MHGREEPPLRIGDKGSSLDEKYVHVFMGYWMGIAQLGIIRAIGMGCEAGMKKIGYGGSSCPDPEFRAYERSNRCLCHLLIMYD